MSEEVVQWLAEIRTLKQQLAQLQDESRVAQESAAHWRKLYNIEARQRRTETQTLREQLEQLVTKLEQMQVGVPIDGAREAAIAAEFATLQAPEPLKQKLVAVIQERDRALDALKTEQENHLNTRKNLTAVIGDTIEQLARVRATQASNGSVGKSAAAEAVAALTTDREPPATVAPAPTDAATPRDRDAVPPDRRD